MKEGRRDVGWWSDGAARWARIRAWKEEMNGEKVLDVGVASGADINSPGRRNIVP